MTAKLNCKIVLLGEGRVGKTSLVSRFCLNSFADNTQSTVQAAFIKKVITLPNARCELAVWDTAGQERFHALGPIYYRDADGALLVYDVTDPDSFAKVKQWVKELRKILGQDVSIVIAGNKADLEKNRQVTTEQGEEYAKTVGATHFVTSAKNNKNVEETFLELTKKMVAEKLKHSNNSNTGANSNTGSSNNNTNAPRGNSRSASVVFTDDSSAQKPAASSCC